MRASVGAGSGCASRRISSHPTRSRDSPRSRGSTPRGEQPPATPFHSHKLDHSARSRPLHYKPPGAPPTAPPTTDRVPHVTAATPPPPPNLQDKNARLLRLSTSALAEAAAADEYLYEPRWYIIDPGGKFRKFWDLIQAVILVYVAMVVPVRVGLQQDEHGRAFQFDVVVDAYWYLDVVRCAVASRRRAVGALARRGRAARAAAAGAQLLHRVRAHDERGRPGTAPRFPRAPLHRHPSPRDPLPVTRGPSPVGKQVVTRVVFHPRHVAVNYLTSWFAFDVVACCPVDLILASISGTLQCSLSIAGCGDATKSGSRSSLLRMFKARRRQRSADATLD